MLLPDVASPAQLQEYHCELTVCMCEVLSNVVKQLESASKAVVHYHPLYREAIGAALPPDHTLIDCKLMLKVWCYSCD
jgi:hypothetical protein